MDKKIKKKLFRWQVLSIIGLNLAYIYVIAPLFHYMGFALDINLKRIIFGNIFMFLVLRLGLTIKDKFMSAVWHIMFLYLFAGEVIFYGYNNSGSINQVLQVSFLLLLLALFSRINLKFKTTRKIKNSEFLLEALAILMFIPFVLYYYKYINLKNLFFLDIYRTRLIFREVSRPITAYLVSPLSRVILPMLVAKNLEKRNFKKVILFLGMIVYIYLCGAVKSVFIGLFALLLFYRGDYEKKAIMFCKVVTAFSIVGTITSLTIGNIFLIDTFIRRVFFIPPNLHNVYMDTFRDNFTYLAHSPLGLNLTPYNLDRSVSMYIGEIVLKTPGQNANVGVLAEGYFSFGIFGGMFFSFIVALIFLYIKMLDIDPKYFGIIFIYIYNFNTSFLSTLLITHGLLFFIVFSYFFLKDTNTRRLSPQN